MISFLLIAWALLASCSAAQTAADAAPECDGMRREKLTGILLAEVAECSNKYREHDAFVACTNVAEERHHARRRKWVECP